jgi:hypothetical protein
MKRNGDWLQTYTGGAFYPLDPHIDDICIEDIAHSLSQQCRFGGHCKLPYFVGHHSILVSQYCKPEDALWGLLHDASEAYVVDVPRPLKNHLANYEEIEQRVQEVIAQKFDLSMPIPDSVHHADQVVLATEARDLMCVPPKMWKIREIPIQNIIIKPLTSLETEQVFLKRFYELIK